MRVSLKKFVGAAAVASLVTVSLSAQQAQGQAQGQAPAQAAGQPGRRVSPPPEARRKRIGKIARNTIFTKRSQKKPLQRRGSNC